MPAPKDEDLARGIIDAIDMDTYRVEKKATLKIALADANAEIEPVPVEGGGHKPQPELDRLSIILKTFNDNFGTLFTDSDRVVRKIRDDIVPKVAADVAYLNARENTPHTARMAHDQALGKAMQILLRDDTQVYKQCGERILQAVRGGHGLRADEPTAADGCLTLQNVRDSYEQPPPVPRNLRPHQHRRRAAQGIARTAAGASA